MFKVFDDKCDEIMIDFKSCMGDKCCGMVFYCWYDEGVDMLVLEFNWDFKYVKIIGVLIFNG